MRLRGLTGARDEFHLAAIVQNLKILGIAAYERAFKILEDMLAETGPWIVGANPSLADISLMPFAARLDYLRLLDLWIKDRRTRPHAPVTRTLLASPGGSDNLMQAVA